MDTFDADPKKLDTGIEIWKDRVAIWFNRAAVAFRKNQIDVSKDALCRSWQYQQALAELEGKELPDPPNEPEFYFGRRDLSNTSWGLGRPGDDPDDPAPVPWPPFA